ncbi:phosphate binding protein [Halalkalicoccus jeotgali B3]|uniref:Phosphate binding protein n=1 Tax=Halalkalicoccus jeotgali (strain DSM 18796 / CECT 7217 / JCM 14584 / KCTC 4019 / B3) TaxID=795797 RepID=D8J8P9_HALJB|nr:phosphate binding protein [Halalkalicoccus jeotgali B3]ELY40496.1 phosphate binding protein [Halalkalicoccus jeotgali B3]
MAATGVTGAIGLAGCTRAASSEPKEVNIAGSSTVFPIAEAVASDFVQENPDINVSVSQTGSGGGFSNFFCPGMTDLNNASRSIAEDEQTQCSDNGIEPIEFTVGTDALTVVVNPEADWVDCVTIDELRQIWQTGGAERWSDVREDWPDEPFEFYGAATVSGTFDYFRETVIGEDANHRNDYSATEKDRTIVRGVRGSPYAIGYFGFAYYSENPDSIKALAIDDGDGTCVEPSLETAKSGRYQPLSRSLFTYAAKEALADPAVEKFVRYFIEKSATDLVSEVGYVPITEEEKQANLDRLDAALEEVA